MNNSSEDVVVIGGGLAGAECAYQLTRVGLPVRLYEMRPAKRSEAHQGDGLAELVCSNSFRAKSVENAVGLIKEEMRVVGSLIMEAADHASIPAGGAHGVDRDVFSAYVTKAIEDNPLITVHREEVHRLDDAAFANASAVIVATGPLTSEELARDLVQRTGADRLYFYDAIAPVVEADSVNMESVFRASRYDKGGDDYLNCPMDEELYNQFIDELLAAEKLPLQEHDEARFFPGCQPIEEIARLGRMSPAFGPMKPVGLTDPKTGKRPFAVVQLRLENKNETSFNIVGFQTRLKYPEQKRVFGLIPGLNDACFLRLGSVHRNTYLDSPRVLDETLRLPEDPKIRFAGQITGVEGYVESTACGLIQGLMTASELKGAQIPAPPATTALGAMLAHLRDTTQPNFQPSNIHWGHFAPLTSSDAKRIPRGRKGRRAKRIAMSDRALNAIRSWSVTLSRDLFEREDW